MDGHDLQPGLILAGRYRIEDLVGEVAGARLWRAIDTILNRSVGVQALPSDDPRTPAFLDAARQSTAVPDPRFLRVLDAVADEGGVTYLVREWTRAVPLAVLLREGPLSNHRAATLVAEAADAIARAHEVGVYHRRIDPATILVKDEDAVRITGLGTDHALYGGGPAAGPAEQVDVTALGRVLYACLVARWPGGRDFGLPAAPTEHGRLLRPRQVRAGVTRDVDTVCDRILNDPPRHHALPLRSAREIAQALLLVGADESSLTDTAPSLVGAPTVAMPVPRVDPVPSGPAAAPPAAGGSSAVDRPSGQTSRRPGAVARALVAAGVALLVAMAAVLAFYIGRDGTDGGANAQVTGSGSPRTSQETGGRQLDAAAVSDFDPQGDDLTEKPELAGFAIDGQPETSWTTSSYYTPLSNLKDGVGLLVDLGGDRQVSGVEVSFGGFPTRYQLWAAPAGTTEAPADLSELTEVDSARATDDPSEVVLDEPVTTRYVLVWLTSLPEEGTGLYRGVVREISVQGSA